MQHCVASYAHSCHRGACSIWTMDLKTEEGIDKLLTIEVHNAFKEIRQVRGKHNRLPTPKEKEMLRRWGLQEGLAMASYI